MDAVVVGCGSASIPWARLKDSSSKRNVKNRFRVSCVSSSAVSDPYKTLRIHPGASVSEVKKAFRQLALQMSAEEAIVASYFTKLMKPIMQIVMSDLRGELSDPKMQMYEQYNMAVDDEQMKGVNDQDWDLWEEWMGWEGAGIRDYSSHINPYI